MQFLFEGSEEASDEKGINFLKGKVVKFNFKNENLKIPHIGKRRIYIQKNKNKQFFFLKVSTAKSFTFCTHIIVKPN